MSLKQILSISTILAISFLSNFAMAQNHTIDMLNKLGKERMVFSKKVISINLNDQISWKSVDKGHNVEFIGMPDGVTKYKSKISKDAN
jgi:plastocyanin